MNRVISPNDVTVTLVHGDNPNSKHGKKKIEEFKKLDTMLLEHSREKMAEILDPIIVIQDPADKRLLVYEGNIAVAHAREHKYNLPVIVFDYHDFDNLQGYLRHLERHDKILWLGITDPVQLLKIMRIYAEYPVLDEQAKKMPDEYKKEIMISRDDLTRRNINEMAGWDDDADE